VEQRLDLELDDDAIAGAETLGDLRALIKNGPIMISSPGPVTQAAVSAADHIPVTGSVEAQANVPQIRISRPEEREAVKHIYPHWPWSWPIRAIRIVFTELVMRPLIWAMAAPRVTRQADELPQGPLLIIANHVTAYDGALVLYALPAKLRRRMAIAMSGEMLLDFRRGRNQGNAFYNLLAPAAYWLLTALFNVFPLPRMRGFHRSFEHAGEAMDHGYSVMIFPEGTRSQDGKLHPFRPGIGLLARESRVPVLPVALIGLGEMKKTGWFRSEKLEIRIGEVIPVEEAAEPARLTARFEEAVRRLQS
jgi:long-chain acyl-CoA synthetase